jgi:hypothetical protein
VRWRVTFPQNAKRGKVPFFCHDITPRSLRVPTAAENVDHPCEVYGINTIFMDVSEDQVSSFSKLYTAILSTENAPGPASPYLCQFKVERVRAVERVDDPIVAVEAERGATNNGGGYLMLDQKRADPNG